MQFVHLRLHTDYSISTGSISIATALQLAKQYKMQALAKTDLHNFFAVVKFYQACYVQGIKPIIGVDAYIEGADFNYRLVLLAKNLAGYRYLCRLLTKSFDNKIKSQAHIKADWLLTNIHNNDIVVLSGGRYGDVGALLVQKNYTAALIAAQHWQHIYGDNYFLEIERVRGSIDRADILQQTLDISTALRIPVVATHPIEFPLATDYEAHEVRVCIATGQLLDDETRLSTCTPDQYFKSPTEMVQLFADIPVAISNSVEIVKKCNLELELGNYFLPNFSPPNNMPLTEYLEHIAQLKLEERLLQLSSVTNHGIYHNRLATELSMINQMGFAGYFLIVADFINWAKTHDVPVGPGRGSGAGSLVAYVLGITDIDPLSYGLLFERFLNPERISMPDFDIDFCQEKRELVIRYVEQKYGAAAVSQIATFGTMSSKAVLKDVGRALGLPYFLCDVISKLITNTPAKSYSLLDAYQAFPDLRDKIDHADEDIARLWKLSLSLENITRNVSKHAAGILIAPSDLSDFCPVYVSDGMQLSQFDKDEVEIIGLVKFDFLGLTNLTVISEALSQIEALHAYKLILSYTDFSDQKVYDLLKAANTTAVFQLESAGMKRLLHKLAPTRFEDIIAVLALYRPGPLGSGMVDDFIKRKNGSANIDYFHPDLQQCLESTYGIIVYQEQVMQISQIIGGYSLGSADILRRAMGKKKLEEMANQRQAFIAGATNRGYEPKLAESLFDLMALFAEYGFNKSHSAAYAVIAYHTAYLKAHYAACFMAATLSSAMSDTDTLATLVADCRNNDITILLPDINLSLVRFVAISPTSIRYALAAIKAVGETFAKAIVVERTNNGAFTDLIDFCQRLDKPNKRAVEHLIKAGCFDTMIPNRIYLLTILPEIIEMVEYQRTNKNQHSLFEEDPSQQLTITTVATDSVFSLKEQLLLEKQAIGYHLSAHLFTEYKLFLHQLGISSIQALNNIAGINHIRKPVIIAGIINSVNSKLAKNGSRVTFIKISDTTGALECMIFEKELQEYKDNIKPDELLIARGELVYDHFRNESRVNINEIISIGDTIKTISAIEVSITNHVDWQKIRNLILIPNSSIAFNSTLIKLAIHYTNHQARCMLTLQCNNLLTISVIQQLYQLNLLIRIISHKFTS